MAFPLLVLVLISSLSSIPYSESKSTKLTKNYYKKTCPKFKEIVQSTVFTKQNGFTSTGAATLRLFFHDCMVDGCDASVLISSNSFNKAEKDQDINESLAGDGFDVINSIKGKLELECPGVVSCADILAEATRDLVKQMGGPYYKVLLGRKDGLVSNVSHVEGHLGRGNMSLDEIISIFQTNGLDIDEMVALTGAGHTIGFAHCKEFSDRLFNYSKTTPTDPALYPKYAEALKKLCGNYTNDPSMSAFIDVMTPGKFDNSYFLNLLRGLGLLPSDSKIAADPRTRPVVEKYAANQEVFFADFAKAMEKVSLMGVKTGKDGEIRNRCDAFN